MTPTLRKGFWLHGRLPQFARRLAHAQAAIALWLSMVQRPYISFSTGKDSLCVLHLVREQNPDVIAVYFDAQCAFPSSGELLSETDNLIRWPTAEPLLDTIARVGLFNARLERETMHTTVYEPARTLVTHYGFDGMAYGLRADESPGRRHHARLRGPVFRYKQGLIACQPIWDWSYRDVWAYIVRQDLKYCRHYDLLWGEPEAEQRLSYWAGETNRARGRYTILKRYYPALWNELLSVAPDASAFS